MALNEVLGLENNVIFLTEFAEVLLGFKLYHWMNHCFVVQTSVEILPVQTCVFALQIVFYCALSVFGL